MASPKELNQFYKNLYGKEFPQSSLARWVKEGKIKVTIIPKEQRVGSQKYDYDLDNFKQLITSESYIKKLNAPKKNPKDFIGKTSGDLLITGIVPREEYTSNYKGTMMYCTCQRCGRKNIQIRFSYLSGNDSYQRVNCGCARKIDSFLATSISPDIDKEYLLTFEDFDKFLFVHKAIRNTIQISDIDSEEYKKTVEYFYDQEQFNKVYTFWKKHEKDNTYYDWSKPSLDHIIPKSKGGTSTKGNLQFLTVFENLSKRDMTMSEWNNFKKQTHTTSDYFIENIMNGGDAQ